MQQPDRAGRCRMPTVSNMLPLSNRTRSGRNVIAWKVLQREPGTAADASGRIAVRHIPHGFCCHGGWAGFPGIAFFERKTDSIGFEYCALAGARPRLQRSGSVCTRGKIDQVTLIDRKNSAGAGVDIVLKQPQGLELQAILGL